MIKTKDKKILLDPKQQAEVRKMEEERVKRLAEEFKIKKEALMREVGVIELAIVKYNAVNGLTPDSVIVPHTWAEGETYLKNEQAATTKESGDSGIITA